MVLIGLNSTVNLNWRIPEMEEGSSRENWENFLNIPLREVVEKDGSCRENLKDFLNTLTWKVKEEEEVEEEETSSENSEDSLNVCT